jgi:hypothetical protein
VVAALAAAAVNAVNHVGKNNAVCKIKSGTFRCAAFFYYFSYGRIFSIRREREGIMKRSGE